MPNIGDRVYHKLHGVFCVAQRVKRQGEVLLFGLPGGVPVRFEDCFPDCSEERLSAIDLEDLLMVVSEIIESRSVEDLDLLTFLNVTQKRQLWDALTPQQQSGLSKLKEAKVKAA
ncbi:MAG TPA: hypothetical protein V6C57_10965 [Coleofasciculaceae cyanobacterium]